jgi:hypothetical protein
MSAAILNRSLSPLNGLLVSAANDFSQAVAQEPPEHLRRAAY